MDGGGRNRRTFVTETTVGGTTKKGNKPYRTLLYGMIPCLCPGNSPEEDCKTGGNLKHFQTLYWQGLFNKKDAARLP